MSQQLRQLGNQEIRVVCISHGGHEVFQTIVTQRERGDAATAAAAEVEHTTQESMTTEERSTTAVPTTKEERRSTSVEASSSATWTPTGDTDYGQPGP
mmetsp:Transcript_29807/g.98887  ORF Transcript_29807/g.98887 Transcript_29807/m.98887 type:complete len:98 (-) Transcript_29807:173-466(-)